MHIVGEIQNAEKLDMGIMIITVRSISLDRGKNM